MEHQRIGASNLEQRVGLQVTIDVGVALIIHHKNVVLYAELVHASEVVEVHQGAGWIVWRVEPEEPAALQDFSGQLPRAVFVVTAEDLGVWGPPCKKGASSVAGVAGVRKDNGAVVCGRINDQKRHVEDGFFGARGGENLGRRIQLHPKSTLHVGGDGLSESEIASNGRVLAHFRDGLAHGLSNEAWSGLPGISGAEVVEDGTRGTNLSLALVERDLRVGGEVVHEGVLSQSVSDDVGLLGAQGFCSSILPCDLSSQVTGSH